MFKRTFALFLLCALLVGCAPFKVFDPVTGNPLLDTSGAFLLSRQDNFTITREWLDAETNTLQSFTVTRNTDEQADAQLEAIREIRMAYEMALKAKAGGL